MADHLTRPFNLILEVSMGMPVSCKVNLKELGISNGKLAIVNSLQFRETGDNLPTFHGNAGFMQS